MTQVKSRIDWHDFDVFSETIRKYMPVYGEGETMASQIATAVNKLVYKWFNDGDVFDNNYYLTGWANDLSSYANWLIGHTDAGDILLRIADALDDDDYTRLLWNLAQTLIREPYMSQMNKLEAVGSIYDCDGPFSFVEDDEEDDW